MSATRILIADDDPKFRAMLGELITHEPDLELVGIADTGVSAREKSIRLHPDIVLMDVEMPLLDGIEAARQIMTGRTRPRIIILTVFDSEESVIRAAQIGVAGFLLKNSPVPEVLRAIRSVHAGNGLLSPESAHHLLSHLTMLADECRAHEQDVRTLTRRELETLNLIGQGRSDAEIAGALHVTVTTVRTYVSRILAKVNARNRAELVVLAYESGLRTPRNSAGT